MDCSTKIQIFSGLGQPTHRPNRLTRPAAHQENSRFPKCTVHPWLCEMMLCDVFTVSLHKGAPEEVVWYDVGVFKTLFSEVLLPPC